jgi:LruC domain-containing protein
MKTRFIISIITVLFVTTISCKRIEEENPAGGNALTLAEARPSDNFAWSTAQQVALNLNLNLPANCGYSGSKNPTVYILDTDYNRIKAGVSSNNRIDFDFTLPKVMKEVVVYLPESGAMQTVAVNGGVISATMDVPCVGAKKSALKSGADSPTCNSECTQTVSGNVTSLKIGKKSTVCLTGNLNGPVEFEDGATLKICGTANITLLTMKKGGKDDGDDNKKGVRIIVTASGNLNANTLTLNSKDDGLWNYGTTTITTLNVEKQAVVENHKTFNATTLNLKTKASLKNTGTLNLGTLTNDGEFNNTASVFVSGNLITNSPPAEFTNTCKVKVTGELKVNGKFDNSGLVSAGKATLDGNTQFNMINGAMLNVTNLAWNGTNVKATGATSMFKISGNTTIDSKSKVTGSLDICDANGIEANAAKFKDNVKYCASFIGKDECNDVGYGGSTVVDTDGDGVPDDSDDYPNDPGKAFDSYYPHTGYAINGLEDLWPSRGDYDFNDLVLKFRTHYVQNASNKFVKADFEVILNAIGAGLHNGLGVQFVETGTGAEKFKRITPAIVTGVSGQADKLEGPNMVKVYNDVFQVLTSYYNNVGDGPSKKPDTLRFSITFNAAATHPSALIPDFYMFRSDDRGLEIHLPDRPATLLANSTYYNTYDDNTQPQNNRWFKTSANLPWGVEVITGTNMWKHPLSKINIGDAYPDFMPWVNSSGTQYNDWYNRPVASKVYQGL